MTFGSRYKQTVFSVVVDGKRKKLRLSSTACGEELQKNFKDCQSQKEQPPKIFMILSHFEFLTFLTFKMTSKFKFDLIRPT